MGEFEEAPTRAKIDLPTDLPDALQALNAGKRAGAAYRSENGQLYRLVAPTWRLDARAAKQAPAVAKPAAK